MNTLGDPCEVSGPQCGGIGHNASGEAESGALCTTNLLLAKTALLVAVKDPPPWLFGSLSTDTNKLLQNTVVLPAKVVYAPQTR